MPPLPLRRSPAGPTSPGRRGWLAALSCLAGVAACGRRPKLAAVAAGETVLAFGDSVTFGTGAQPGEDWPALLAAATGWRVLNGGVPGDTAQAAAPRLRALLDEHRPALVLIEIGGNDFLRRRAAHEVKEDLRAMIRAARDASAQVVLVAVPELSLLGVVAGKPADSPIYAELADEERVALVEDVFADVLARPGLRADRIHPNAAGYRAMAEGLLRRLAELGLWRGA